MFLPLIGPADQATLTTDPTFQWTRVVGAHDYHLVVSQSPTFSPSYDSVYTDYTSFTPYVGTPTAGDKHAYPNGTYYWKVEARNHAGTVITTSLARQVNKQMTQPLIGPADQATLTTDPTFQWTRVVGAHDYHLMVSQSPTFSPSYDSIYTDYTSFTPYIGTPTAGDKHAYPNGTYYWKVEARNHAGTVIATSLARQVTKQMSLSLLAPADRTTLITDPTFQWDRVVGAHDYHLVVSKSPSFSPFYDSIYTDYVSFTAYMGTPSAGDKKTYTDGTYYWKVEARNHAGTVIVTSSGWMFKKSLFIYLPLIIK
jgi:uncharacterized protein YegP (UPF0339 family)